MVVLNFYFFENISDVCLNKRHILISDSAFNLLQSVVLVEVGRKFSLTKIHSWTREEYLNSLFR